MINEFAALVPPAPPPKANPASPNKFPIMEGHSLALSRETMDQERPMYNTKKLEELEKIFQK